MLGNCKKAVKCHLSLLLLKNVYVKIKVCSIVVLNQSIKKNHLYNLKKKKKQPQGLTQIILKQILGRRA